MDRGADGRGLGTAGRPALGVRVALIGAGLGVFAAFSVLGQFSSLPPAKASAT